MFHLQCDGCGKWEVAEDGSDPDSQLKCDCCPEDHHHGQAAAQSGAPCRPITITLLPGTVAVS